MLNDLVRLADYLDHRGYLKEANVVDFFISKAAAADDADITWNEDDLINDLNITPVSQERGQGNDYLTALSNHPLGQKILNYVKNAFLVSDSGTKSEELSDLISVERIKDIVNAALKYDEDWQPLKGNKQPMSPNQFWGTLNEVMRVYYKVYPTVGMLDGQEVRDFIFVLYRNYKDLYQDTYGGSEEISLIENPNLQNITHGLSPDQYKHLMDRNDREIEKERYNVEMDQAEQDLDPKRYQSRQDAMKTKMKREFPEEWHNVLFGE